MSLRTWKMYACRTSRGKFEHIGDRRWVKLNFSSDPIVPVLVEELDGDPRVPEVTHYGWEEFGDRGRDRPEMIMVRAGATPYQIERPWVLLEMCFTYGMQAEVDRGRTALAPLRRSRVPPRYA